MHMNAELGFEPVSFAEITQDSQFWKGCESCINYDILERKKKCNCLCTAMLFDPEQLPKSFQENTCKPDQKNQIKFLQNEY